MEKKRSRSYYFKLMRYSVGAFIAMLALFCIGFWLANYRAERLQILLPYERVLLQMHSDYQKKQDDFSSLLWPWFYKQQNVGELLDLIADRERAQQPEVVQRVSDTIMMICSNDADIRAVAVYDAQSGKSMLYDAYQKVYIPQTEDSVLYPFLENGTGRRQILPNIRVQLAGGEEKQIFGIAGCLPQGKRTESGEKIWSTFVFCYDADRFAARLSSEAQKENISPDCRYLICTEGGTLIFDNMQEDTPLSAQMLQELSGMDGEYLQLDGARYYVCTVQDTRRGYSSICFVPGKVLSGGLLRSSLPIALGTVIASVLLILIMWLSARVYEKRVSRLKYAMKQIGRNDLSYRIQDRGSDEFSEIAARFNTMCDQLCETVEQGYLYELRQRKAEIYALQTSINPHFLYNTLESIREKLWENGEYDGADLIIRLSRIFDYQLHGQLFVTLQEELDNLETYIQFFSIRFEDGFRCDISIPPELMECGIPKFTLQPLLENYFVHGMVPEADNEIRLRGWREEECMILEIADNGKGIAPQRLAQIRKTLQGKQSETGIGLFNVHERLRLIFGQDCGLQVSSPGEGKGTTIQLRLRAMTVEQMAKRQEVRLKTERRTE